MVTIILAVPVFLALTFPLLLTVATLGLLDLNVTTLAALLGFTFVLSVKVFPGFNTFFLALSDTLLTDFLATYTVTICFAPLTAPFFPFTVIFAFPVFLAFTIPLTLTVATLLLLELKVKFDAFDVSDILKFFFLSRGMTTFPSVVFFTITFDLTFSVNVFARVAACAIVLGVVSDVNTMAAHNTADNSLFPFFIVLSSFLLPI